MKGDLERVARAIVDELARQDNGAWNLEPDSLTLDYLDQGEMDFGLVAQAAIAALGDREAALKAAFLDGFWIGPDGPLHIDPDGPEHAWRESQTYAALAKGESMPSDIADKLHAWQFNVSLECSGASLCAIDEIALGGAVLKLTDLREVLDWVVAKADTPAEKG